MKKCTDVIAIHACKFVLSSWREQRSLFTTIRFSCVGHTTLNDWASGKASRKCKASDTCDLSTIAEKPRTVQKPGSGNAAEKIPDFLC